MYEWSHHAFAPDTIEALEILSNSHMTNNLLYAVAQVVPYLVAAAGRLHHMSTDLAEWTTVKAKHNELKERVVGLEEKCKFDECYDFLVGEKSSMED